MSKNRMFSIQVPTWTKGKEELRAVRMGSRVGHGGDARPVVIQTPSELVRELIAGISPAVSPWTSGLYHEVLDDSMDHQTVIEALLREVDEVLAGTLRFLMGQQEPDVAL